MQPPLPRPQWTTAATRSRDSQHGTLLRVAPGHAVVTRFHLGGHLTAYEALTGAAACEKDPQTCDLSRGIAADDRAGTVFHLIQPDPAFLYKLTLAYADVLPRRHSPRQARTPLSATGGVPAPQLPRTRSTSCPANG